MRVGRQKTEPDTLPALLEAAPNPTYIFDQSEKIVAINDLAKRKITGTAKVLADCSQDSGFLEDIRAFIGSGREHKLLIIPGYMNTQRSSGNCVFVKKMGEHAHSGPPYSDDIRKDLFLFTIVDFGFTEATTQLFQKAYNLTPAEVSIAALLASGEKIPEIATSRGIAVKTI